MLDRRTIPLIRLISCRVLTSLIMRDIPLKIHKHQIVLDLSWVHDQVYQTTTSLPKNDSPVMHCPFWFSSLEIFFGKTHIFVLETIFTVFIYLLFHGIYVMLQKKGSQGRTLGNESRTLADEEPNFVRSLKVELLTLWLLTI